MRLMLCCTLALSLVPAALRAQEEAAPGEEAATAALEAADPAQADTAGAPEDTAAAQGGGSAAWSEAAAREDVAEGGAAEEEEPEGFGWGGVPALNYNSDDGFGYGVIGNLYWYEKGVPPYKYSLMAQIYLTTKWVQIHRLKFDALEVFDLPLRIWGELQYYATISQNYCGVGNAVTCDLALAEAEADRLGYEGEAREAFVRHYYQLRYINPWVGLNGRWKLTDLPNKLEVMGGWRGAYYYYGDMGEKGPYPGSLYDQHYPGGTNGFASVMQVGLMLDNRDNEPAPTKGYWIEGSIRGATWLWGSAWDFFGANLTLRGYVPLNRARDAVLASRLVLDGAWGDMPIQEIVTMGGSHNYSAMGGEYQGRGIRSQRFIGRIRAFWQNELRWTFFYFGLLGQKFDLGALGFLDAGYVGWDWDDFRGDPLQLMWGAGGGLRLAWNKNFIIRLDLAASPFEQDAPGIYLNLAHIY